MSIRRPTRKEADRLLLQVAARLCSQAKRLELLTTVDIHTKNGLQGYLASEASNIESFVLRTRRYLDKAQS